jgi:hypothetical protein
MPMRDSLHSASHPRRRVLAFTLAGLGLMALAAGAGLAPAVASAPASAAPASAAPEPAALSLNAPANPAGLGCWITGDMIWSPEGNGDGNPAAMAQAMCGGR